MYRYCTYSRLLNRRRELKELRRNLVLGIESSCDDTGAAVIDCSGRLLGESLSTQLSTRYGGVIPTFAMVFHKDKIEGVVNQALQQAGVSIEDIHCIAVTNRPGLKGPLAIGTDYAKYLCTKYTKPMIPIHHMAGHALTVRMENEVEFPYVILLISGGHCLLGIAKDIEDFTILGSTRDNPPGETLDKIARTLKLHTLPQLRDVSGGRAIEILAKGQDYRRIQFGIPLQAVRDCNFSFSGIKGHMDNYLKRLERSGESSPMEVIPEVEAVCAGVQYTVAKHLCQKLQRGIEYLEYKEMMGKGSTVVVSGGVASNQFIRKSISLVSEELGWKTVFPRPKLCTDNGVMIAWAGLEFWRQQRNIVPPSDVFNVQVFPRCPLGDSISGDVAAANLKCKWIQLDNIVY